MDAKYTPLDAFTAALGPIRPAPSLTRLTANVSGGPIKFMLYKLVSVHIKISCLDFRPPTIKEPELNRTSPAELVARASNSNSNSASLKDTSMGSIIPVRTPLASSPSEPNTTRCLSVSEVITWRATVGTWLAPERVDSSLATTDTPSFSFQR